MQSSSSTASHFDFESFNEPASSSQRFKQSSNKRKQSTMSKETGRKRLSRSSQDSFTSDDESKLSNKLAHSSKPGNRAEKNRSSKKRRKGNDLAKNTSGKNDSGELVSGGSENKMQVAVYKHFPTNSKPNYSDALNLTPLTGSIEEGQKLFGVLIKPIPVSTFMDKYWEQKPIRIQRRFSDYYKDLISTEIIDKMLRENHVEFTKNIDITQYKDGVRETLNPVGRAMPPCVWHYYGEGNSIRILNPQTFLPAIHSLNATLQEYFQCMIGANVYLTPKNSQGFAPHYDDIEAFVLQVEGKKRWRLYKPKNRSSMLPRESSKNFKQEEIGEPCLDVVLEAGDLLYFPRGYIHQALTLKDYHSLHITVSAYQKQTFGDLLETLIPMALKEAINENEILRRGLPLNIWQRLGVVNSDNYLPEREAIIKSIMKCFDKVCSYVRTDTNLDNAVDQMALRYQHDALPPKLTPDEELRSVYSSKAMVTPSGQVESPYIECHTKIRLIRANILRMVRHEDEIRVYYSSENSKEYHGFEENFLDIDPTDAPAVEVLIKAYPTFITPDQLQLEDDDHNLSVAQDLWEKGMLMTEAPLL
ncbi:bifunctional lysine-specific demethylase and histidyl-hydroxylase NO66-like [Bradysia coprophila]|uniref:bifunctional lysine-specific demethylase and histidyl-hydroxylase NO66-like n=1 Tax=Bradysia coprophila TaxID=38358 RepID=UPI00187D8C78|nr:bifunctional lysine-specific demethylase and histidyl-hydroxylase NO66-like [Bradysia coprophila]XP_037031565.1 bifunctional lysine-specific demethylase and histidyl-hydroxylase NO66-like [Bradysia coprophila]